jgi:GMP synthase-like glutamine amidotransferase
MLQLSDVDPPERLADWLTEAGADLETCRPAAGELPEQLDGYAGVVCMGGEMSANDDADHPWLPGVRKLLANAVAHRMPVLGVCLGAQLLAASTGGAVRPGADGPEAGTALVAKRDVAAYDPLFAPLPMTPDVIQFHHDEIHRLPPGATLLASSTRYQNQAFRVGVAGYGLQFHIETSPAVVLSWVDAGSAAAATVPARQLDPDHLEQVHADIEEVWRPMAARFVALASGELAPASSSVDAEGRPSLPLLGH